MNSVRNERSCINTNSRDIKITIRKYKEKGKVKKLNI